MKGLFITGTGTGVGKTYVTGLLLGALRARGVNAISIKPVQTGSTPESPWPDLEEHWRLSGWRPTDAIAKQCAPFTFRAPVSPHLTAQREGKHLDTNDLVTATRAAASSHDFALVEGAGGVLVPLNEHETMLDLLRALSLPVLVVAEAGVGTINHSLLTLQALRSANLSISGVLLSMHTPVDSEIAEDNARMIEKLGATEVFGILHPNAGCDAAPIQSLIQKLASP